MAYTIYAAGLTAGAANTKGSYVELVASTPYDSSRLHLILRNAGAARRFFLIDLATGGVGVETVVVANVAVDCDLDQVTGNMVAIDVDIPAGTRLSARCQSVTAASTFTVSVLLENRALGSLATPVTYGANTSQSRGTQIDPGGTANTKSAYVEFSASTSARIDALLICATISAQGATLTAFTLWRIDVATGLAGLESVLIPDLVLTGMTNGDTVRPGVVRLPVSIPAGTRLALRHSCSVSTTGDRILALTVIGMQEPASGGGSAAGAVAYVG